LEESEARHLRSAPLNEFFDNLEKQSSGHEDEWIVDGIISYKGIVLFTADEKFAKTYLAIYLALCVASGKPFLGKRVMMQGPVYIHSPEGTRQRFGKRLKEMLSTMNLDLAKIPLTISEEFDLYLNDLDHQARIEEHLQKNRFILQIFDPLKDCFRGSFYNQEENRKMEQFLKRTAREYSVTHFISNHKIKSTNTDQNKEIKGDGSLPRMADDIMNGKKHGVRGRSITFCQRERMPHPTIYLMLPEVEGMKMRFELCTEDDIRAEGADDRIKNLANAHLETIREDDKGWAVSELRGSKGRNEDHSAAIKILENEGKVIRVKKKIYLHPENGGENPAVLEFCPKPNGDRSLEKGQKSDSDAEKVLSQKPTEALPDKMGQKSEGGEVQPKSFLNKLFGGKTE